ncbi:MAG TPA: Wadjet anti-phage system protein JetD domain-containing protein [Acidimicrobiales bacterium]
MTSWTSVSDLIATLRKRWATGRYLSDYARKVPWTPIELPVKAPSANELLDQFDDAVRWAEVFRRDSRTGGGAERFSIIYRTLKGKNLGSNSVPARVRIESFEQLCALLGTQRDVRSLDEILNQTVEKVPSLVSWVVAHPFSAVARQHIWRDVLATVIWVANNTSKVVYLRQIDVEGIDTKFVEQNRKLLDDLLSVVLPEHRIDPDYSAADFARRFRFRAKPSYTRLRLLNPQPDFPKELSEVTLRSEELAVLELVADTIFVVENEITYLAFPSVPNSVVIFGAGFSLAALRDIPWMDNREIVYWGDIDTHGFDILDRLRTRFNHVRSMMMDQQTLLAHPRQWVTEPSPTNRALSNLDDTEAALYRDLTEDRFGRAVRLEQERVRFSWLQQSLEPWSNCEMRAATRDGSS